MTMGKRRVPFRYICMLSLALETVVRGFCVSMRAAQGHAPRLSVARGSAATARSPQTSAARAYVPRGAAQPRPARRSPGAGARTQGHARHRSPALAAIQSRNWILTFNKRSSAN